LSAITAEPRGRLTSLVSAFVDQRMRAALERAAREGERSLSGEVRLALRSHLAERKGAST
jgi:hypothetical protein